MTTRFKRNPLLEKQLAATPQARKAIHDAAKPALAAAEHATPVGATGAAQRSLTLVIDADGVRLQSTDPFWHLIEFGSRNNPAYAPMRRGVRAAGLRLDDQQ
jgi:hypothetical protein